MAGEKILVVDDSRNIREVFLAAFDEYDILTASNAKEALDIIKRPNDIDLIILDVMMPDKNGLELLQEIKKINAEYKVVIMTGYSSKDIAIESLRQNADEYVEKPFDIVHVKEVVQKVLRESRYSRPRKGSRREKVRMAMRLMERNYNKAVSLQEISKELCISYKYLSRILKEKTGNTFNEYRLSLKMKEAMDLLKNTDCTIGQIAYKIGYQNPDSFMKAFRRTTGTTPTEYRNKP